MELRINRVRIKRSRPVQQKLSQIYGMMRQTAWILTGDGEGVECTVPEPRVPVLPVEVRQAHPLLRPTAVTDRPDTEQSLGHPGNSHSQTP